MNRVLILADERKGATAVIPRGVGRLGWRVGNHWLKGPVVFGFGKQILLIAQA